MAEEDLIFGKNRHLFGGIAPGDMVKFTAVVSGSSITITATLPNDTVVDGQTLCSVAGAVIRRKSTGYPKDEFDGDLVKDIGNSMSITDKVPSVNNTYYYEAFPYSTQGVYNRDPKNRVVMKEPPALTSFTVEKADNLGKTVVLISYSKPSGIAGVKIRKSTTGYPIDENDGELVADRTTGVSCMDQNVEIGVTYYYRAFPYTSSGAHNYSGEINKATITLKNYEYLYGYDINLADSNPDTRVTYPSDVDNAGFTPAYMYFSNSGGQTRALTPEGAFQYGSWPRTSGEKFMPRPCMLYNIDAGSDLDGTVAYYLNQYDYTKKEDGSAANIMSFNGNAMMEWPKIYTKRWEENGVYHFRCSDAKLDDDYECWCNYDKNNNEIDHFYTAIYTGSNNSGRLASLSNKTNFSNQMASTEITYAKENGPDWYTDVLADRLLINDLLTMIGKSTDCQGTFGSGRCGFDIPLDPGTMNTKGLFWGSSDTISGVKVFGMENYWGNLNRHIAGWISTQGKHLAKITRGTKDGTTVSDYNTTGEGYIDICNIGEIGQIEPRVPALNGGYISNMATTKYGRFPSRINGSSSSTYECDQFLFDEGSSLVYYAISGGHYASGLAAGPFYSRIQLGEDTMDLGVVTTLSLKPSKK